MAKHKAPTEVAFAPTEEHSAFQTWVNAHWPKLVVVAILASGLVLFGKYRDQQSAVSRGAEWANLLDELPENGLQQLPEAAELSALTEKYADSNAGPWVKGLLATQLLKERDYAGARQVIDELGADYPQHTLLGETYEMVEGEAPISVHALLDQRVGELQEWEQAHPRLFGNEPPPSDAPKVRINTTSGSFDVALYPEKAPEHVANFLKLCGEGYYDGTNFHRVIPGFMIQGGDPNSRDEGPDQWGLGGPDYKLDPEFSDLAHFEGVLAAAKSPGDTQSSGSQFYVTLGSPHHLDSQHTIFGALVGGKDVVESIGALPLAEGAQDRPESPAVIESTEIL